MKFINYLTSIAGVEIFPLISLLIFFLFFFALSIYMFRADKNYIAYMSELPITEENENQDNGQQQ